MNNKNRNKTTTLKTLLMLSITSMMLVSGGIIPVHGDILFTVEINSSTVNGPVLSDSDLFGKSVTNIGDLDGDGINDIAVGAHGDDGDGNNRGAIHIILLNSNGAVKNTIEINSNTVNGPVLSDDDRFGSSVTNIGDLDGDGVNDIAVGAYGDDEGGTDRGTIHIIFLNSDGTPKSTIEINSNTVNGPVLSDEDFFGSSVTNIGDLDGDGINDIAVGAGWDDEGGTDRGTIHIILLNSNGTPKNTIEINDSTTNGPVLSDGDTFGRSVTNIGDLDNDGVNDIAVGAHGDDEGGTGRGAIHIILLNSDGTPKNTIEINDSTTNGPVLSDGDFFGISVTSIGDLDGDGINDIAVGAYQDDEGGNTRGTIHIILLNSNGTPKNIIEINSNTANGPVLSDNDHFGSSVTNIGDLDNDGVNDIAVGAYFDDEGGSNRGTVHIIFLDDILPTQPPIITSLVADDPDDLDNVYSIDDTITILFDSDTNMPGETDRQTKADVDNLFTFTESLGQVYRGQWSAPDTFTITIKSANNAGPPVIDITTVTPAGITPILSFDETSSASSATSSALSGDFGTASPSIQWILLPLTDGIPSGIDCDGIEEYGRVMLDAQGSTENTLYLCTASGWIAK